MSNFELGVETPLRGSNQVWETSFSYEQNAWYNHDDVDTLLKNKKELKAMIEDFLGVQLPRLMVLESYASGRNNGISYRPNRKEYKKANHRAKHNYGGFISIFNTGYLFGIPVKTETESKEEQEAINEINEINETDALNSDLGYDCSRFGRAFELHYRNSRDEDRIALSSVFETFCVYSSDVEHKRILGVRVVQIQKASKTELHITAYTDKEIITYKPTWIDSIKISEEDRQQHFYGEVPIIEWQNNRFRQGDYETVVSQIDLYDAGQSDTANYMHDLNDAMLVVKGSLEETGLTTKELSEMKDANILALGFGESIDGKPLPVDAEYIYKQYDVAGTEAYKKRLQEDIHKFSYTPDFTDRNFSSNISGVAMKYKLMGTEQVRSMKERQFSKALRERYRLIDNLNAHLKGQRIDASAINIIFTENMPVDVWADIQAFMQSGGELSQKTLLSQLAWVDDAQTEINAINEERNEPYHDAFKPVEEVTDESV